MNNIVLENRNCFEYMEEMIKSNIKVDLILTDMPYNITANSWDTKIDISLLWNYFHKIINPNTPVIMFSSQPFTTDLINSNRDEYKYEIIWSKNTSGNFILAKKQVLKRHENLEVFYKEQPTYNPQFVEYSSKIPKILGRKQYSTLQGKHINKTTGQVAKPTTENGIAYNFERGRYPGSVLEFNAIANHSKEKFHPTQKPVSLLEWLIKTYTNEGDIVFDPFAGSFSCGIACLNTNRKFIGCELDTKYFEQGKRWIESVKEKKDDII